MTPLTTELVLRLLVEEFEVDGVLFTHPYAEAEFSAEFNKGGNRVGMIHFTDLRLTPEGKASGMKIPEFLHVAIRHWMRKRVNEDWLDVKFEAHPDRPRWKADFGERRR